MRRLALLLLLLLFGVACSGEPATGPVDPVWDRTACEHCQMVISDRRHAVQIREVAGLRPHQFDDLGCALTWLDASGIEAKASAAGTAVELWVRDAAGKTWIDGWQARYESGLHSPMGYGFAAAPEGDAGAIAIETVREQLRALGGKREVKRRAGGG
jgi:copper chaperone NosL